MKIINAQNQILGRMAAFIAVQALSGEEVVVVNCQEAVISGHPRDIIAKYKNRRQRGEAYHGPFFPRSPERIVKRTIQGMLPHKKRQGRKALSLVKCYLGLPSQLRDKPLETVPGAQAKKLPLSKMIALKRLCQELGWQE